MSACKRLKIRLGVKLATRSPDSLLIFMRSGLAIRMAIGLGLHATSSHSALSPFEQETRKRTWWCLVAHEAGCSVTFGRPFGFGRLKLSRIPLPANNHDKVRAQLPSEPCRRQSKAESWIQGHYTRYLGVPAARPWLDNLHGPHHASSSGLRYEHNSFRNLAGESVAIPRADSAIRPTYRRGSRRPARACHRPVDSD